MRLINRAWFERRDERWQEPLPARRDLKPFRPRIRPLYVRDLFASPRQFDIRRPNADRAHCRVLPLIEQFRKPRTKKARIRKKWSTIRENWRPIQPKTFYLSYPKEWDITGPPDSASEKMMRKHYMIPVIDEDTGQRSMLKMYEGGVAHHQLVKALMRQLDA